MDSTDTPASPDSVTPDPNKLLIVGAAGALMFLGIVLYANASAVRQMRRTSDNLDALMTRVLETARPVPPEGVGGVVPPAQPVGRPAQPGPRLVEPDPAAVPNNGAGVPTSGKKAESGDASAQS